MIFECIKEGMDEKYGVREGASYAGQIVMIGEKSDKMRVIVYTDGGKWRNLPLQWFAPADE